MRREFVFLFITAVVVGGGLLAQQKEDGKEVLRKLYFGDKKEVIAGFLPNAAHLGLPDGAKLQVESPALRLEEGTCTLSVNAKATMANDKVEFGYRIVVCKDLTVAVDEIAQPAFLLSSAEVVGVPLQTAGVKADVGEVCYWKTHDGKTGLLGIRFAVRNIIVRITPENEDAKKHLFEVAKKVADYLRKQPTYKSLEASGLCPKIIAKAEKTTVTAEKGSVTMPNGSTKPSYSIKPVKVDFRVEDPQNLKVKVRHICHTDGQGDAAFSRCIGRTGFYLTWHLFLEEMKAPVKCRVVFTAVNERLLWTTKEITITILPPK